MKNLTLGEALGAVADGAAVEMTTTPFMQKHNVVLKINPSPNWNGTCAIQDSPDQITWTDRLSVAGTNQPAKQVEVVVDRYVRRRITVFVAGAVNFYMTADN